VTSVALLDNRDSFVWNLAQALCQLGAEVTVLRSDRTALEELRALAPDALVISPGPGRPEDAGISIAAVRALAGTTPILGVCLGHQAIGACFGAQVARHAPRHGRTSSITHSGGALFAGVPSPFLACRYHSLHVTGLGEDLVADAHADDGTLMALHHRAHPTFGVQFHPESFRSEHGARLLGNFLDLAR
jgi:anthranilate synthase/aminodeoxychorismate synthase-like glutamine amidotransferase